MAGLFAASNRPALGSMSSTTHFEDGSPGDTSTYEEDSDSLAFTTPCLQRTVIAELTGVIDLGAVQEVSDWSVSMRQEGDIGNAALCVPTGFGEEFEGWADYRGWALEISENGTDWSEVDTQSEQFATFTAGSLTRNHTYSHRITGTFEEGTLARYLRHYSYMRVSSYDSNDTITAKARVSDMRMNGVPVDDDPPDGIACEEIEAEPGTALDGAPIITLNFA